MNQQVTLRRGHARPSDLSAALDALGIGHGADFVICAPVAEDVSLDGAARRGDPDTSIAAAKLSRETHAGIVLAELAGADGTASEIARRLGGWKRDSVSPRIGALRRMALVESTGEVRERQQVNTLTPAGRDKIAAWAA